MLEPATETVEHNLGVRLTPFAIRAGHFADVVDARDALRLIAQLKPQQRLVLLLRAEGHSYKAICELTC